MVLVNRTEAIAEAFRNANGITYETQLEDRRQKLQQASLLKRGWHLIFDNSHGFDEKQDLEQYGKRRLTELLAAEAGIYPRGLIYYLLDGEKQGFMYNLIFPGRLVGEQGEVGITFTPEKVFLRQGSESVIEIAEVKPVLELVETEGKLEHVLHLPKDEGISLITKKDSTYPWYFKWNRIRFATWYPDLLNVPLVFKQPLDGKIIWNNR